MSTYHREITHFLKQAGAENVHIERAHGRKHPRVRFRWRGREVARVVSGSPSDVRAVRNMLADLRRTLGPPEQPPAKHHRRLEDMTTELQNDATAAPALPPVAALLQSAEPAPVVGKVGLYADSSEFVIPSEIAAQFGTKLGVRVTRLSPGLWGIDRDPRPTGHGGAASIKTNRGGWRLRVRGLDTDGVRGTYPAAYQIVAGGSRIEVKLIVMSRDDPTSAAAKAPKARAKAPQPVTSAVPTPPPGGGDVFTILMRATLRRLGDIEQNTPFRLRRTVAGVWTFVAPRIRVDGEDDGG